MRLNKPFIVLLLTILPILIAAAPSADLDDFIEGNYWALIIGISKYPALGPERQLPSARKDAESVAKLLKERYGFSSERVVELYDEEATHHKIVRAFTSLHRRLTDKDNLFIYYAAWGESDKGEIDEKYFSPGKEGYWLSFDAEPEDMSASVFHRQFRYYLATIPSRHIFAVVDSAFSGSLMRRTPAIENEAKIKELYQSKSRWILAPGGSHPVSEKAGQSQFAGDFMKRLLGNKQPYLPAGGFSSSGACLLAVPRCLDAPLIGPVVNTGDEGGQFVFRLNKESQKQIP